MITIPENVLDKIIEHRLYLAGIVRNLRSSPSRAVQFEKSLADAYLMGDTRLTAMETWMLSACCVGDKYGGGAR